MSRKNVLIRRTNIKKKSGTFLLILTDIITGSTDAIMTLVNAGASVTCMDKDGLTALHCASSRGHHECIETLVRFTKLGKIKKEGHIAKFTDLFPNNITNIFCHI